MPGKVNAKITKGHSSHAASTIKETLGGQHAAMNRVGSGGKARAVDPDKKIANLHRLRRIEGQIRGLHDMVQGDRYCADILIQIAAVQKSLASIARQLLGNHLKHCVSHGIRAGGAQADAACEELLELVAHLGR